MNTEITFSGLSLKSKLRYIWTILRGHTLVINWDSDHLPQLIPPNEPPPADPEYL